MNTLYFFNPENDLALGCNSPTYSAPRNAIELRKSGGTLPLWYSGEGDCVLTERTPENAWLERIREVFNLKAEIVSEADGSIVRCSPWGWSNAVKHFFITAGVDGSFLPDETVIHRIREMSHRRLTISVLSEMKELGLFKGTLPVELTDTAPIPGLIEQFPEEIFFKSPWSSSGRGVIPSKGMPLENVLAQSAGMIRRQGSVMIEQAYNKKRDFAMLFHKLVNQPVTYVGLSLFDTASQSYTGNILADEETLLRKLSESVSTESFQEVREAILPVLNLCLGNDYEGYFGVDMMVVEDTDGKPWIHPCVEINLRMTMGVVAHLFTRDYLASGTEGRLVIGYGEIGSNKNYFAESGRLCSGTLSLVPPSGKFHFLVEVSGG